MCHKSLILFRYDALAFRYVAYVAIPLLMGYTVYSLVYETHRGWYSFIISTLTSFVYMFGFVRASLASRLDVCLAPLLTFHRPNWFPSSLSTINSRCVIMRQLMTPKLISNRQSVAHMPMKAMIYKTLSTVVDDLFA
jgi:Cleft lip and palate transmembrane protein 1 (CLPTM1).